MSKFLIFLALLLLIITFLENEEEQEIKASQNKTIRKNKKN